MLYSHGGQLTGRTDRYEVGLLLHLLVLVSVSLPISSHKVKGEDPKSNGLAWGVDAAWFELGISANRAAWASRWLTDRQLPNAWVACSSSQAQLNFCSPFWALSILVRGTTSVRQADVPHAPDPRGEVFVRGALVCAHHAV